jgi:hypothetical protein
MIRSSLLDRFALEDSTEVYFVFFSSYIVFYTSLEIQTNSLEFILEKQIQKLKNKEQ